MTRPDSPLGSYSPQLLATLLEGARKTVILKMPYNKAVRFRQRIYSLRAAMREAKHSEYDLVSRVKVSISWLDPITLKRTGSGFPTDRRTPCEVEVAPHDSEFDDFLAEAGIKPRFDVPNVLPPVAGPPTAEGLDPFDILLADIEKEKKS